MTVTPLRRRHPAAAQVIAAAATLLFSLTAAPASAQPAGSERWTVEAVVSGSAEADGPTDPFLLFDVTGTARLRDGLDVVIRPYAHRLTGGDWTAEMYQLQVRYMPPTRVPLRLDAGIIGSPVGLNTLELIPSRNPTIDAPFFYFAPLPRFDERPGTAQLISGGYPLGAIVSSSGAHWDARAGVTDQSPTHRRNVLSGNRPPAAPQLVAGGGYTPVTGLRIGASFARGAYRDDAKSALAAGSSTGYGGNVVQGEATEYADAAAGGNTGATVLTVEGEYALGYTRVAGEWIRDAFETAHEPAIARGFSVEAVQTLTPRWFAAARVNRASSPVLVAPELSVRRAATSGELTLGYRVSPEVTLRGGYQVSQWYGAPRQERALALSAVWARRWR
jgi:hypothetical protein